jgi:hypothetical protein
MDIKRTGSAPSAKGPGEYFTGIRAKVYDASR